MNYKLKIGWLYPDLMSTYGDRGNIIVLSKRCEWRKINAQVLELSVGFDVKLLKDVDILFMGGAQDTQQEIVSKDFTSRKIKALKRKIKDGTPGLYICGAYQFLGKYYKEADGTKVKGLGILDLFTENPGERHPRLTGDIVVKTKVFVRTWGAKLSPPQGCTSQDRDFINTLVGFENHGGRTYLGKGIKLFGQVIKGFGNNGTDKTEGAIYKNSFGTYLHGPILPKNPALADYLIGKALELKYKKNVTLEKLDDSLEEKARESTLKKMSED